MFSKIEKRDGYYWIDSEYTSGKIGYKTLIELLMDNTVFYTATLATVFFVIPTVILAIVFSSK